MRKTKKSTFLKVSCPRCKTKHILFGKSSIRVKCEKCNYLLIKTSGGKAKVRALVKEVIWN